MGIYIADLRCTNPLMFYSTTSADAHALYRFAWRMKRACRHFACEFSFILAQDSRQMGVRFLQKHVIEAIVSICANETGMQAENFRAPMFARIHLNCFGITSLKLHMCGL